MTTFVCGETIAAAIVSMVYIERVKGVIVRSNSELKTERHRSEKGRDACSIADLISVHQGSIFIQNRGEEVHGESSQCHSLR